MSQTDTRSLQQIKRETEQTRAGAAYLGESSDAVKAKAAEFAVEQTARATAVAEDVVGAVTDEARRQGLTVEGTKSAVGDISAKVGRVVDAAGKGVSEGVKTKTS